MYKQISLFNDPLEIYKKMGDLYKGTASMSEEEKGFLFGLIREKKPKKILEVGVYEGGVSIGIQYCLELLQLETKLYSIDILDNLPNSNDKMGYLIDDAYECGFISKKNKRYTGITPDYLDEIAPYRDIDFLILDTVHWLPGEVLDFLSCFPYLKENATVVLHDICGNYNGYGHKDCHATKILFDVVSADKYFLWDEYNATKFPNIGAFDINENTKENIIDIFSSLSIRWTYDINDDELLKYQNIYEKNYSEDCINIFNKIIRLQKHGFLVDELSKHYKGELNSLRYKWERAEHVVVYGNGNYGKKYLRFADFFNLKVDCIAVSDDVHVGKNISPIPVVNISDIEFSPDECCFVIAVDGEAYHDVEKNIHYNGFYKII